jgi:hypothetical protein
MPTPIYTTEIGKTLGKMGGSHLTVATDRGTVYNGVREMRVNSFKFFSIGSALTMAALYLLYRDDAGLALALGLVGAYYFGRAREENHWFHYVKTKPAIVGG